MRSLPVSRTIRAAEGVEVYFEPADWCFSGGAMPVAEWVYRMDQSQVEKHIELLKHMNPYVRYTAADALLKLGDASAVPALIEALKDDDDFVRLQSALALGKIGDNSVVPALIESIKERDFLVRSAVAKALGMIGDSVTLPRIILAHSQYSPQQRIDLLDALRSIRADQPVVPVKLRYTFPAIRPLCQAVLNEDDIEARKGAQTVLNWLNGERELVIAAMPDTESAPRELLRPGQRGDSDIQPETLLRGADQPNDDVKRPPQRRPLWKRLFTKRRKAAP